MDVTNIRPARGDDYEAIVAFTRDTWPERNGGDYIPDIYHEWIDGTNRQRTIVAESDSGEIAGLCQAVMLSEDEAWAQGMRVNPEFRGEGVSKQLNEDLFSWAHEQGATVCRIMVFSWNAAGLGGARAAGFEPACEFRWAHPEPDTEVTPELSVSGDPAYAWRYWTDCTAREQLGGLTLDLEESWALSELTRRDLHDTAADDGVFAVVDDGLSGVAYRARTYEREIQADEEIECDETTDVDGKDESTTERIAEYGVGAWEDLPAARSLFAAIRLDAARVEADRTRVLILETPRFVSDVARLRIDISDDPDFVLAADLTNQ